MVNENKAKVALEYGPIVFCAEGIDNAGRGKEIIIDEKADFSAAFDAVTARDDFAEISEKQLGIYPQSTGEAADQRLKLGTVVDPSTNVPVNRSGQPSLFTSPHEDV